MSVNRYGKNVGRIDGPLNASPSSRSRLASNGSDDLPGGPLWSRTWTSMSKFIRPDGSKVANEISQGIGKFLVSQAAAANGNVELVVECGGSVFAANAGIMANLGREIAPRRRPQSPDEVRVFVGQRVDQLLVEHDVRAGEH